MKINSRCLACLAEMQEQQIRNFSDEEKKINYMKEIFAFLASCDPELSAPVLVRPLSRIYEKYWGKPESLDRTKRKFNDLLLSMQQDLEQQIRRQKDSLESALCFARTGNYIDYAAVRDISKEKLLELLDRKERLDEEEYGFFRRDLETASSLVYLTDNCGEIVLDKIAMKILKEQYPDLHITAIVRGAPVVNDADMETAGYIGLDEVAEVIDNGSDIAGTDFSDISLHAKQVIDSADLILSKGQGNFETAHGCGKNIYYLFLCKCDWFVEKFHARRFQGMFVNERRVSF